MPDLDALLYEQETLFLTMERLIVNLKKVGRSNFTQPMLQSRLQRLNQTWDQCRSLDVRLYQAATTEQRKTLPYFQSQQFITSEQAYWEGNDYITQAVAAIQEQVAAHAPLSGDGTFTEGNQNKSAPLPRIPMPIFSGSYTDWISFRDLFESLVITNESISNVQRLHYLKVSVQGDASSLLKNIPITDANFQVAWAALKTRYDRSRHIVDAQLTKLFDIPPVTTESVRDLKRLRDFTSETVSALTNLDRKVDTWDDLLAFMTVRKLDPISRREWEMKIGETVEYPTYKQINDFLEYRIRALEAIPTLASNKSTKTSSFGKGHGSTVKAHVSASSACYDCGAMHSLYKCERFKSKPVEQRQKIARENHLCNNCLSGSHQAHQCTSQYTCTHCKQKHHSLLHNPAYKNNRIGESPNRHRPSRCTTQNTTQVEVATSRESQTTTLHSSESRTVPATVMLATAWIFVASSNGRSIKTRALLDQGSQSSFVTESLAQILRAPREKIHAPVSGLGGTDAGIGRAMVNLTLTSCNDTNERINCKAIVFQRLTSYVPQRTTCAASWRHLEGLELADPNPNSGEPISVILGADVYANIICEGLKRGPRNSPIAQKTTFGWIISGPNSNEITKPSITTLTAQINISEPVLFRELRRFWELEEVPTSSPHSEEELACEAHFAATHRRLPGGRYCVRLPFKGPTPIKLGSSSHTAETWLLKLEKKFIRDPELISPYCNFMDEYLTLGHMVPTSFNDPESTPGVYLPHHPVIKESSTTRLRVVFNASSKTSNHTSLNDHLMIGAKLQADLPATILRWRRYKFAYTADITKMYRQIVVDPVDTRYQQILWRSNPTQPITPYRLTTVTYGTASAPFLAMRVLKQLADDEEVNFPAAARIIREHFYVDDVLFGAPDEKSAHSLRHELDNLLARGGFVLRKWMSSHASLLADIPFSDQESTKHRTFDATEAIKVLGIGWVPETDSFCFNASSPEPAQFTKRTVLSITAQLFDPLGWLTPVVITAKIFLQELWIASVDWDEELPPTLAQRWNEYCRQLPALQAVLIPRWNFLETDATICEIHGFADASKRAYAAVVYLRVLNANSSYNVSLIAAKSKVAPIKTISVPRLELCAATLLAKLIECVQATCQLRSCRVYAWTDSTVVLAWLEKHPSEWQTFVANRVATIHHRLPRASWNHVPTSQNPADCASRGLLAGEITNHPLWWQGPPWLKLDRNFWPSASANPDQAADVEAANVLQTHVALTRSPSWDLCNDVSSWSKLVRITAYCLRFIAQCHRRGTASALTLSGSEISTAQMLWIKIAQAESFQDDIHALKRGIALPRKSRLRKLNPFLDKNHVLRVGGRLELSLLSYEEKHPIILSQHRVSTLIAEDAHRRCLHGGPQLTTTILRQNYWLLGHRPFVRKLIHNCVPCARERAQAPQQMMGSLPSARVSQARAFLHTGVDYAGPFLVRASKGRGRHANKAYLALFVCLSTRAIHLELVSDYSSAAFLAAYRRFCARRGLPSDMYSDNGTTFQGADTELQIAYKRIIQDPDFGNLLATDRTTWHFIPPGAPHFGGLWEAGVKCTKHHLRRVLGAHTLTYEEFETLIAQIEACLNSRPIGPLETDPSDSTALTPGHFLIGAPLLSVPSPTLLHINENRLSRWQLVQQMLESFWKRWSAEYFHSLQIRSKWNVPCPNIQIGDLVLIRHNTLPPSKWMLGRITKCHPGPDSRVRVVTVRTSSSELKRPITQLCLLPIHAPDTHTPFIADTSAVQMQ